MIVNLSADRIFALSAKSNRRNDFYENFMDMLQSAVLSVGSGAAATALSMRLSLLLLLIT